MRDHFIKLFQHLEWADARVLQSLRCTAPIIAGKSLASVRAAGDTPIPTDYIAFARGASAATRKR